MTHPPATWPRPVPTVGDRTSAAERAADPAGWAFDAADAAGLDLALRARRDVRRFRADPVAPELLRRVLEAGHRAPSVGHSQPWRFVVVTDADVRARAALLADRARLAQAAALDDDSGRRLLDLDLEGIREAPVGIVVCCDRRTPPAAVLGRATFADADVWSCACAIENMWLAARAAGLGMGWVTLFDPADLLELVGAPAGVETLGWLCLGWPDERPPAPGLERRGWSQRAPLDDVVFAERWPGSDAPPPPARPLRSPEVPVLAGQAIVAARDGADALLTPPGSLGVLDRVVDRVVAAGLGAVVGGTLVLAAADHPVAAHGVSAFDPAVTRDVAGAAVAGRSLGAVAAATAGLSVLVVDAGVEGGALPGATPLRPVGRRGDLVSGDGLCQADCATLVEGAVQVGARVADAGLVVLGEIGVANTTVAAALAALLLELAPHEAAGLGAGADRATVERKRAVIAAVLDRVGRAADPMVALAAAGGGEIAALTGVVLGAAGAGGVVVVDGLATAVAALVATRLDAAVAGHLVAGQRSREPAAGPVLDALGLEPLLDLRMRAGEGVGACLAAGLVLDALRLRREAARTRP